MGALRALDPSLHRHRLNTLEDLSKLMERMPEDSRRAAKHKLMREFDSLDFAALRENPDLSDHVDQALVAIGVAFIPRQATEREPALDDEASWLLHRIREVYDVDSGGEILWWIGGNDTCSLILGIAEKMPDEADRAAAITQLSSVPLYDDSARSFVLWWQLADGIPRMLKTEDMRSQAFALLRQDRLRSHVAGWMARSWPQEAWDLLEEPESVGLMPFIPVVESRDGTLVPRT